MTLEEAMKRIEALEAKLEMTAPAPAVGSHQLPAGWMLVDSESIPWSYTNPTWQLYDPSEPDDPWDCDDSAKQRFRCLVVARPDPNA